jgi:Protein of unknown function (DUF1566)
MNLKQKTPVNQMILIFLSFSIGILLSGNAFAVNATVAQLAAETTARKVADTAERAARIARDNSLTAAIKSSLHSKGQHYGGGIVFYVYDGGRHGLIAAASDQDGGSGIRWFGGSFTNTRARANGVRAGKANTAIIIANQGPVDGNAFAATVCNEFSVADANGVSYGDWYLPSKAELNLLFQQRAVVGGFASNYYWSSTENGFSSTWGQDFSNGDQGISIKNNLFSVRAIRSF